MAICNWGSMNTPKCIGGYINTTAFIECSKYTAIRIEGCINNARCIQEI